MVIDTKYDIGDIVYLTTDQSNLERMITMIQVTPEGVIYGVSCGEVDTKHYECELSEEINIDYL